MKVYELAKKLKVTSVFLMEQIRKEWKLPVKNHMETLTADLIQEIEKKFYKSSKAATKTTAVKKKKDKKTVTKRKSSVTKKSAITRKTKTKKEKPPTSDLKKEISETQELKKPPVKRKLIIRRKTDIEKPDEKLTASATAVSSPPEKKKKETSTPSRSTGTQNIRSDMVSIKTINPLDENFWDEKKEEESSDYKKQIKKPIAEKDVSSKFNATDFRKREVIFQPRKKRTALAGDFKRTPITTPKSHKRIIKVDGEMELDDLCKKMSLKKKKMLDKLKEEGLYEKNINILDFETIALITPFFGFEAKNIKQTEKSLLNQTKTKEDNKKTQGKPPVVTIMGHVDHGKTTLLDTIRKTKIAQSEAGGITQQIGAYTIQINKQPITFIDTPGHASFTQMRSRGAQVTDIVVLMVASTDGVMPQTLEALNHAKSAKVPIIVAISKMDAPGANPDKIKKQMSEQGVIPEEWGGDTNFIPISATQGQGIEELLEHIQLMADIQELKCDPEALAQGVVLEARKEKGLGSVVSFLIQDGTLKSGDNIFVGKYLGRVRQMKNDQGQIVKEAKPGFPVEVIGFRDLPQAGDTFHTIKDEKIIKNLLSLKESRIPSSSGQKNISPEDLLLKMELSNKDHQELNIILKADRQGSVEALQNSLDQIKSDEVSLKIIHSGTGGISTSDVLLAGTVSGIVLGFNVRPDEKVVKTAKEKSVQIYTHSIIYELLDQVKKLMLGLLKSDLVEEDIGWAEVREVFSISKLGSVAGCYVTKGHFLRNSFVRLVRDGSLVHEGKIASLRRFKDDVKEVGVGLECGISLEKFNDIKPKDTMEAYIKKEKARTEL